MNETLHISDLDFEVRRSDRRKTLGLTVDRGGELVVHAPSDTPEPELRQWVESKLLWVHRKLLQKEAHVGMAHEVEFVSGESISYLGQGYRLKLVATQKQPLVFDGEWFTLRHQARDTALDHFREWFIATGSSWLEARVETWTTKTSTSPSRVVTGDLGYRWGSCGKNQSLYFNWRLLQLPVRLIDYVIVHEMTHLAERNHSPAFWQAVERAMPDWRNRKQQLDADWNLHGALSAGRFAERQSKSDE